MVKEFEPEDPMELVGVVLEGGDPDQALETIVQEYLLMGWTPARILSLFRSPRFAATHQIYRQRGETYVEGRVHQMAEEWRRGWLTGGGDNA
ncbi:MAG: hypothetical protein HYU29_01440 [Chloroflexi bacterium]|nr:hypothetical protein [Chloroflexota bacterium]